MEQQKAENAKRGVLFLLLALVAVLVIAIIFLDKQVANREPSLYLIPQGFRGVVTINYGKPDASPLPREGRFIVYNIPQSGVLNTSTREPQYEVESDEFYFIDDQGRRTKIDETEMIHGQSIGGKQGDPPHMTFYVETTEEREKRQQQLLKKQS